MKTISVYSNKGGVGKTMISFHLAQGLALTGHTVLLIDNDPQNSLTTQCCGILGSTPGMAQVYRGEMHLKEVAIPHEQIKVDGEHTMVIVPGNNEFHDVIQNERAYDFSQLKAGLDDEEVQERIDYVIIDNGPAFSSAAKASIVAADEIIIPARPQKMDFEGLIRTMSLIKTFGQPYLAKVKHIIPSIVRQSNISEAYLRVMKNQFGSLVTKNITVDTVTVPESIDQNRVVYLNKFTSKYSQGMISMMYELFPELKIEDIKSKMESVKYQKQIKRLLESNRRRQVERLMQQNMETETATV